MDLKTLLKTSTAFATPWAIGASGSGGGLYLYLQDNKNQSKQDTEDELSKLVEAKKIKDRLEKEKKDLDEEIDSLKKDSEDKEKTESNWDNSHVFIPEKEGQWNEEASEIIKKLENQNGQISFWGEGIEETELKTKITSYFREIENHKKQFSEYLKGITNIQLTNKSEIEQKITELRNKEKEILERISKVGSITTNIQSQITNNQNKKSSHTSIKDQLATQKQNVGKGPKLTDKESTIGSTDYLPEEVRKLNEEFVQSTKEVTGKFDDLQLLYSSVIKKEYLNNESFTLNLKKATIKEKGESEITKFSVTSKDGKEIEFKVKKNNKLLTISKFVDDNKNSNFNFFPWTNKLKTWNKKFSLRLFNQYDESTDPFLEEEISLVEIFQSTNRPVEDIIRPAMRVLLTIEALKFRHLNKNKDGYFEMKKDATLPYDGNKKFQFQGVGWAKNLSSTWKLEIGGFSSKEEFIGYWILKTLELLSTNKVDFSDILDPVYQESSYSK